MMADSRAALRERFLRIVLHSACWDRLQYHKDRIYMRSEGTYMHAGARLRRTLLAIAQRRQRPGTGSAHQFLTTRTQHMHFPDLTPLLHPLPWAVVGAAATRLYMPERMTQDLDILVRAADAATVRQQLRAAGCRYIGDLAIGGSSWTTPDGWSVDVLEGTESWCSQAIAEAQQ